MVPLSPSSRFLLTGIAALVLAALLLLWRQWRRRRAAERLVAELRSQLQTVTATMREGVITYDMDRKLTFVNPAFERLTGYPDEELRDQEFLQYIHPNDRPAIIAEWDRLA
ncbi:MAG TPA: PAS domain-containing protein, partial [Gemmatimonadales bacterium]|nr:PAS domain-containing protein [Gemmatimonadales bacterium]